MDIEKLKEEIINLSIMHQKIDEQTLSDLKDAEMIEFDAEKLIIEYCKAQDYEVNGFSLSKRNIIDKEDEGDYFRN